MIDQYGACTGIVNISSHEQIYEYVFVTCNFSKTYIDAKIAFDIKDLAGGLATEGIAVLRYDKRTYRYPQECLAMIENDNFTVNDETIDDAIAAVDLLRETERIDPDNISVLGHSWGGYLTPRIAARDENISGLILLAAGARSLPDLIIEQTEYLAALDGTTDEKEVKSLEELREQAKKVKELNQKYTLFRFQSSLYGSARHG